MKVYRNCTTKLFYVLVIDTTLAPDDTLRFRKNLLNIKTNHDIC